MSIDSHLCVPVMHHSLSAAYHSEAVLSFHWWETPGISAFLRLRNFPRIMQLDDLYL